MYFITYIRKKQEKFYLFEIFGLQFSKVIFSNCNIFCSTFCNNLKKFSYNKILENIYREKGVDIMNNNDISGLINMISKMDKNQLASSINQLNKMLSNEDKQRIMQALNNQNKH